MTRQRKFYKCECGFKVSVRQAVKNALTVCPHCGERLPQKKLMQLYRDAGFRVFRLDCLCGAQYTIAPPSGEFQFKCKCGRELLSIRPRKIGGVELPRYIEAAAGSE